MIPAFGGLCPSPLDDEKKNLVVSVGFEPTASPFVAERSVQLGYETKLLAPGDGFEPPTSRVRGERSGQTELTRYMAGALRFELRLDGTKIRCIANYATPL